MEQIISSFQHHYKIDLLKGNEFHDNTVDYSLIFQTQLISTVLKIRKKSIGSNKIKSKSKNNQISSSKSQKSMKNKIKRKISVSKLKK